MSDLHLLIDYAGHDCERDMLCFIARGPGYSKQFECKPENMKEAIAIELKALTDRFDLDPEGEMKINIVAVEE